jgi:fragile-site associated tumor suppressor
MVLRNQAKTTWCPLSGIYSKSSLLADYTCCDLVVKLKECKKSGDPPSPELSSATPLHVLPERPETPGLSEDVSEPQQIPESFMTLQVRPPMHPSLILAKA